MFKIRVSQMSLRPRFEDNRPSVGMSVSGAIAELEGKQIGEYTQISMNGGDNRDWSLYADLPKDLLDDSVQLGDEFEVIFKKVK